MTLFKGTTSVPVSRSTEQIKNLLRLAGFTKIMEEWGGDCGEKTIAMRFSFPSDHGDIVYQMPIRTEYIYDRLSVGRGSRTDFKKLQLQAERTAWRQLHAWVQVQIAMMDYKLAEREEIFLPYRETKSGKTVYELLCSKPSLLGLAGGK